MTKIRKGDIVTVRSGDDQGKKGKVLKVFPKSSGAIVEGINLVKKHKRRTQQDQQGGVISIELPLAISNLLIFCKSCNRGVKAGFNTLKDGTKVRFCRACKETL
jgi:large subunit ribosomal protein L24